MELKVAENTIENEKLRKGGREQKLLRLMRKVTLNKMMMKLKIWRKKVRSFLENKIQKKDYSDYKCKLCKYGVNSQILLKVHMTTELGMAYNPAI